MTSGAIRAQLAQAAGALQRGDRTSASRLCEQVLARVPDEPNALHLLGVVKTQEGTFSAAIGLLERARKAQPTNAQLLNNLGIAYRRVGQLDKARAAFEGAIQVEPRLAAPHYNLGNALRACAEYAEARKSFETAIRIRPDYADAYAALASLAEGEHDLGRAQEFASRAVAIDPSNVTGQLTLARVDLREDRVAEAKARLEAVLARPNVPPTNRVIALGLTGQALDRLGRHREAFQSFAAANAIQRERYAEFAATTPAVMSLSTIERLHAFFSQENVGSWPKAGHPQERAPVFFVGFPRSGTTLIEQILASHPAIATIEEKDALAESVSDLVLDKEVFARIGAMGSEELERRRRTYWKAAEPHVRGSGAGIVIDKLPLNTILLGPAHRLFPGAKVIFALRDPRDVVLSCFQQTFDMNAAMYELLRLETTARYYDSVMRLYELYRQKLPLDVYTIRYEDLLADFEGEVRRLLNFLQVPWADEVTRYRETAKKRLINTPSASQVVEPLYTSARGKWRNYRAELEPQLPLLEPWVKAFGYDPA